MVSLQGINYVHLGIILIIGLGSTVSTGTSNENEDEYLIQRGACKYTYLFLPLLIFLKEMLITLFCTFI